MQSFCHGCFCRTKAYFGFMSEELLSRDSCLFPIVVRLSDTHRSRHTSHFTFTVCPVCRNYGDLAVVQVAALRFSSNRCSITTRQHFSSSPQLTGGLVPDCQLEFPSNQVRTRSSATAYRKGGQLCISL